MRSKRLHARLFMARQLLLHALSRLDPTVRRRRGLTRFEANFYPEGLRPLTREAREILPLAERCIACDLCLAAPIAPPLLTGRDLALRVARSCNDWTWALPAMAPLKAYEQAERLCPVRIPLARIATLIGAARSPGAE